MVQLAKYSTVLYCMSRMEDGSQAGLVFCKMYLARLPRTNAPSPPGHIGCVVLPSRDDAQLAHSEI